MELEDKSKELKRRELLLKLRDKELQTVSRRKKYFDEQLEKTLLEFTQFYVKENSASITKEDR